eukprot:815988-Prorocentrum_minimum.AAC.1
MVSELNNNGLNAPFGFAASRRGGRHFRSRGSGRCPTTPSWTWTSTCHCGRPRWVTREIKLVSPSRRPRVTPAGFTPAVPRTSGDTAREPRALLLSVPLVSRSRYTR